jgi:hypothetical protein
MRRTAFDESRDQRIANEAAPDRAQLCAANGCPNRWSVGPARLCSAHARADRHLWPQITQEQADAETDRSIAAQMPKPEPGPRRGPRPDEIEAMRRLSVGSADPKAWAKRLREREERGERLTGLQRSMWREALKVCSDGSDELDWHEHEPVGIRA